VHVLSARSSLTSCGSRSVYFLLLNAIRTVINSGNALRVGTDPPVTGELSSVYFRIKQWSSLHVTRLACALRCGHPVTSISVQPDPKIMAGENFRSLRIKKSGQDSIPATPYQPPRGVVERTTGPIFILHLAFNFRHLIKNSFVFVMSVCARLSIRRLITTQANTTPDPKKEGIQLLIKWLEDRYRNVQ
jgi:hypothetical protein